MTSRDPMINSIALVRIYLLLGAGAGLFSLLLLLDVSADKKNVALWGYSIPRLAMLLFLIGNILLIVGLLINTYRKPRWFQDRIAQLQEKIQTPGVAGFFLLAVPLLIIVSGLLLIFWTSRITDEFFQAYLIRLAPIVFWFTILGVLTLLLLICLGYRAKMFLLNTRLVFPAFRRWLSSANLYKLLGILIIVSVLSFGLLYLILPAYRRWFINEDQFLENLATGLFLFAFLLSLGILIVNRGGRLTDFLVPFASLFSFLEEVSYGERFFESIPKIDPDKNVDALHDFFKIGFKLIRKGENDLVIYGFAFLLLVAILLAGFFIVRHFRKRRYDSPFITFGPLIFTLIGFAFILISLILDLDILDLMRLTERRFIEEMLELSAAFALFFGAISIYQRIVFEDK